jgi:DNA-binding response OmpR family regulator
VLVIEDERAIADFVRMGLGYQGYEVAIAADGMEGLRQLESFQPHLVIVDIMLPALDGMAVCRRLRLTSNVPVLMLTARDGVRDRVEGLDSGADDYLTKPFDFEELAARVRALLRRGHVQGGSVLQIGDLRLEYATREVTCGGIPVKLSTREFDLLAFFMRHPRQVLTREALMAGVWGYDFEGEMNIVEVYVGYLRDKLGDRPPRRVQTVRGVGYVLKG